MPRYPYRDLGTKLNRDFRNNLNANFDDIEADIRELYDGVDDLDTRIDNIVADVGNSNTEIVDARNDSVNNVTYPTLKDRLDDTSNKIGILKGIITSVVEYGVKGDGTDETTKVQQALDSSKDVFIPPNMQITVSNISLNKPEQRLIFGAGSKLISNGATGTIVTLKADYAKIINGLIVGADGATNGIETKGFRNLLFDTTVTGTTVNALSVNGLETIVILGRYKGGTNAGIQVNNHDLYLQNVYIEGNGTGLYSNGFGSITAHHVHSFNNSVYGFYLIGASLSQLTSCYADTNGSYGWVIQDSNSGMTLVDCWGYKSSNITANRSDFDFRNAKNIKMFGCHSSGTGAQTKSASFSFDSLSQVDLVGCYAEIDPSGVSGLIRFTNCGGALEKYNRATDVFQSSPYFIDSDSVITVKMTLPSILAAPSIATFEVTATMRYTDNTVGRVERYIIMVGEGVTVSSPVTNVFPSSPTVTLTNPSFSDVDGDGYNELTFNAHNANPKSIQVSFHVRYLGTSRGFN